MAYLSLDVQLEKIEEARRESTHENMMDERDQENLDLDLIKEEGFDKSQVYQLLDVMGYLNSTSSASEL